MPESTCALCGSPNPPAMNGRPRRFCSRRCGNKFSRENVARGCGIEGCANKHRAQGLCGTHYNQAFFPDSRERWPENPEAKARRLRVSTATRRARMRGAEREPVDRNAVGERDGWVCGICEERIDRNASYPDPMSASLDHIEPLSLGGHHTYANSRIAHLTCNVRRSNRSAGEQLALI